MSKNKKHIKRSLVIAGFVLINFLVIGLIAKVYYEFNSGADRKNLSSNLVFSTEYNPEILIDTSQLRGRKLTKIILDRVKKDYSQGWYVKNLAFYTQDEGKINDYYTDSLRKKIRVRLRENFKKELLVESGSTIHNLHFKLFSDDGQLLYLEDKNVEEYTSIYHKDTFQIQNKSVKNYQVVLLLEDGFWRIRQIHTDSIHSSFKKEKRNKFQNPNIKGINYYPQQTPWFDFWNNFNEKEVFNDFKKIKDLGLNCIRIFIPYEGFGKEKVKEDKLENLKKVLDIAQEYKLKTIITFFDFYSNYSSFNYGSSKLHVKQIIEKIKDHKAVYQYDIKNEPDLDFKLRGKERVLNWLKFIIKEVRISDPNKPITIGWSNSKSAENLIKEVDYVSYHFYKSPSVFNKEYTYLSSLTKKPIIIQEYGKHSFNAFWFPFSNTEYSQAKYYKKMQENFEKNNIQSFLSWTLYDFPKISTKVFGQFPHKVLPQKHYGCVDFKGNVKPVAQYLTSSKKKQSIALCKRINKFTLSLLFTLLISIYFLYKKCKK